MKTEPDWKEIAMQLGQRVNFAIQHLKADGAGLIGNIGESTNTFIHWHDYFAEAMEMIPSVRVDREILATMKLPRSKRLKEQNAIKAARAAIAKHVSKS